jgi:hypothetical protein
MTNNNIAFPESMISPEALALLGGGKIAYVKMIRSEDVQRQFPQAPELAPGTLLYALHAADGTLMRYGKPRFFNVGFVAAGDVVTPPIAPFMP